MVLDWTCTVFFRCDSSSISYIAKLCGGSLHNRILFLPPCQTIRCPRALVPANEWLTDLLLPSAPLLPPCQVAFPPPPVQPTAHPQPASWVHCNNLLNEVQKLRRLDALAGLGESK